MRKKTDLKKSVFTLLVLGIVTCACSEKKESGSPTIVEKLAGELNVEPLDYSQENLWICLPWRENDVCNRDFTIAVVEKDGTYKVQTRTHNPQAEADCFYVYPTVDLSISTGNHDDIYSQRAPKLAAQAQVGLFSSLCRVFVPFYRQVTIGTYFTNPPEEAVPYIKKAFMDVAAAFEYYLENWNNGRPIVILGHSQGAQMSTYLLRFYFDENEELRNRLVVALPIGFNFFVPAGNDRGGSLKNIPICTAVNQTGCLIHYRSYPDGYDENSIQLWFNELYTLLANEGFIYRTFDPETDEVSCVNPATSAIEKGYVALDVYGNKITDPAVRVLRGLSNVGGLLLRFSSFDTDPPQNILLKRYTARCRKAPAGIRYLAVGYYEKPGEPDIRGDPINIDSKTNQGSMGGLHVWDYELALPDLLYRTSVKIEAFLSGD